MVLFNIIIDLFRDHKLNGWWKAVWIIFLIFFPFLTADDLPDRPRWWHGGAQARPGRSSWEGAQDAYIKSVAGR